MARTEKAAFWILIFLLMVGIAAKFYKLKKDAPNFKVPIRESSKAPKEAQSPPILNLNSATAKDLEGLPSIGRATAEKIVAYRAANGPFKEKTDLMRVDSISISKYKTLEPFVRLE